LTHSDFIAHREKQEAAPTGIIARELEQTHVMLAEIGDECRAGERLTLYAAGYLQLQSHRPKDRVGL
jgi:hypothetical protein